jgi:UDP-3-O-[3-hydroxymyristoyl] glucosamine N-acyltransferase
MSRIEILPQSIAKIKTIILKPRLDLPALQSMCEKKKTNLFSKLTIKPRLKDVQLVSFDNYYEPYLFIGGKYSLDYCKEHSFIVDVEEGVDSIYIAGQEFFPKPLHSKSRKKILKLAAEEYIHYEKETYFVLDKMKREIISEAIPFSPFGIADEKPSLDSAFKKMEIPTEDQINFLKSRIALRPTDLAAIVKEVFEITDRIIVYVPMYNFLFENLSNHKQGAVLINAITSDIELVKFDRRTTGPIFTSDIQTNNMPAWTDRFPNKKEQKDQKEKHILNDDHVTNASKIQNLEVKPNLEINLNNLIESEVLGFPAIISGEVFSVGDNVIAIVGDITISSGSNINKTLVVKGTLRIGDNCVSYGKLKALRDIVIGADTVVNGDIIAGGNVFVGSHSKIKGSIEAEGIVKFGEGAKMENKSQIDFSTSRLPSDLRLMTDIESAIQQ